MNFGLTSEQLAIRDHVKDLLDKECSLDYVARCDEQGKPPMLFNKQVTVFLVCLSISLVFWLLQALSSSYPATIVFPVHYHHLPVKKVIVNELPAQITVDLKTTGFRIIYYSFEKEKEPIDIDVSSGMTASGVFRDAVTIPTRNFEEDFLRQLGSDVEFVSFHPDSIVLMFTDKVSKRVPVLPEVNFSLRRSPTNSGWVSGIKSYTTAAINAPRARAALTAGQTSLRAQ